MPALRPRTRLWLLVLLLGVVGAGVWPAYRYWHSHRSAQFKSACDQAVAAKDWNRLRSVASAWTAWDPAADDGWVFRAEAALQLGDPAETVRCLGRVRADYHGALQALALRGDILFSDLNRVYDAEETWLRMLRINPLADVARQRLIYFYAMTLQRRSMLEQIERAMELECEPPEAYSYLLLAYDVTFSDGLAMTTKWRRTYPDDETLEVAQALYAAKYTPDKTLAIFGTSTVAPGDLSLIDACLEEYPANIEVLAFHLDKAVHEGDASRVVELLAQSPAEAEGDARFWRHRGWYLAAQDRHQEAEQALRKALELHPVDWRARLLLAGVLRRLDRLAEAEQASHVALLGKELHRQLFEMPNARALTEKIFDRIDEYLRQSGSTLAMKSLGRRMGRSSRALPAALQTPRNW